MKITLFYEHVTVLDYAFLDPHLGVVGNSLLVDVEFIGTTDHEGVVYDFSYAKKKVKEIIDRDCDHRLVVPQHLLFSQGEVASLRYSFGHAGDSLSYSGPLQAFCEIPSKIVSYESITSYLENRVMEEMPPTVEAVKLKLREESIASNLATFHYTHGLKDHYGNCQRLLHGHRNTIEVWVNGLRRTDFERDLAHGPFGGNIHFCYWENVMNKDEVIAISGRHAPEGKVNELKSVKIKYRGNQGEFFGELPGHMVYFTQKETTVENLSIHFAQLIKARVQPSDIIQLRAFEGIGKGSLTTL